MITKPRGAWECARRSPGPAVTRFRGMSEVTPKLVEAAPLAGDVSLYRGSMIALRPPGPISVVACWRS